MLRAGWAEVDLTPPVGSIIPGQWLTRTAQNVRDPLLATALVLEANGGRCVVVSADALSLKNRVATAARHEISRRLAVPASNVLLAATHTHTGPPVADVLGTEADPASVELLERRLVQVAADEAAARLAPVEIGWATGEAPGLAFPRRWLTAEGRAQMHPPKGDPRFVRPEDEADATLTVLVVRRPDGRAGAVVVNFGCHPIFVGGASCYSADYPGVVRRALKRLLGDDVAVVYLNAPCGDVGPDDVADADCSRYGEEWMERVGTALGARAVEMAALADTSSSAAITGCAQSVDVPVRVPEADQLAAAAALWGDRDLAEAPQDVELVRARELLLLQREVQHTATVGVEVSALRIGEGAIVGLPGEIFAAFGRAVRARSPFAHTAISELTNGCHGYVPTEGAFVGGGYETDLCRSSKLAPQAGELMVDAAADLLAGLS